MTTKIAPSRFFPAVLFAVLGAAGTVHAQAPRLATAPASSYDDAVSFSRDLIDSLVRARNLPGLSAAVSVDGGVVWSEGFGYANIESKSPVTTTSKFRIGSVSKPLTAVALGQLVEAGLLDLDAPVQQYVPSFPEKAKGVITARLLAGHLAGVRHYQGAEFLSSERYESVAEGLEIFDDDSLLTPPGERYSYSSYGWNLLSAVIEGASGMPFLEYMQTRVLDSMGLRHTVADYTDSIITGRTEYYVWAPDGALLNAPYVDNSYKWAGGGYLSTPEDLLRFANAHLDADILQAETIEMMWTSQHITSGEAVGYGIGWRVSELEGRRLISHGGGSVGGTTMLGLLPEEDVIVAVTSNVSGADFGDVPAAIALAFVEGKGR